MMKKFFIVAFTLPWLWVNAVWATPARVQGAENNTGFATSITATLGAAVTSGNALALMVVVSTAGAPTLSDNGTGGSATYTAVCTSAAQGGYTAYTFYAQNVTHAPTTVTATTSGGQIYLIVDEVSGVATSSILDGTCSAGGANINNQPTAPSTTNGVVSGALTTSTSGDFVWSASFASAGISLTQGTGWSAGTNLGGFTFFGSEYQVQASAGSITATFTSGTNNTPTMTGVLAFKPPGAAPTATPMRTMTGAGL